MGNLFRLGARIWNRQRRVVGCFLISLFLVAGAPRAVLASDGVELSGDVISIVLPAAAAGLTVGLKDWTGTLELAESAGLAMGATYALKYSVDERRPRGGKESFPSAHTSISFTAAEFARKRYGWTFGIPAYAVASYVAYTRVESGAHYPHDVIAGAGIGILSSYIFTRPFHGWDVRVDGDTRSVSLHLARSW